MANALEYILRLTDMLTPGMKAAAAQSENTGAKIKSQFTGIEYTGKKMAHSVDELKEALSQMNQVKFGTHIKKEFDDATKGALMLEKEIEKLEGKKKGGGLKSMVGGLMAGIGVGGVIKSSLSMAADREQQKVSFGVMTGSQKAGDKMVDDVVKMGASTPYETNDLLKNAQMLKAFGVENEKVIPSMRMIGDVGAGNVQKMETLTNAFGKVTSAGKLSGQELNMMIDAGYNPLKDISAVTGESIASLRQKMEKGAISAKMLEGAFKHATGPGGDFYQMMEKQSKTLSGRWSTFMDAGKEKLLNLGNALMPIASMLLDFGTALLSGEPGALLIASAIGLVALSLTWASIQTAVYSAYQKSAAFFTALFSAEQWALNTAFLANPITWVIASIIALIAIIGYVIYTTDGWGKQWDSLVKFFKFSWDGFKDYFMLKWLLIQNDFMTGIEYIKKGWYNLKSLWDEDGANASLAQINDQQNARAAEIAKQKGVLETDLKSAKDALTWELKGNGKGLDTITGDIKKKLGIKDTPTVSPLMPKATGATKADFAGLGGAGKDGKSGAKDKADSINSGGQKSIIINIGKQIEKLEMHVTNATETADQLEYAIREGLRRAMFSLNGVTA